MNFNATLFGQLLAFVFFVWFTMQYVWPYIQEALEEEKKKFLMDSRLPAEESESWMKLIRRKQRF